MKPDCQEVRYAYLLPREFEQRLRAKPIAYLPLGTLEWHGEYMPLGADAFLSEHVMICCAREFGGIVMPPIHLGPCRNRYGPDGTHLHGVDFLETTVPPRKLPGSCYWVADDFFVKLLEKILVQVKRAGFRAVFADGYGPSRRLWFQHLPDFEQRFDLRLFGVDPQWEEGQWTTQIDHAGRNETSLMMAIDEGTVDLTRLAADRAVWPQGVVGEDPRDATAAHGRVCIVETVQRVRTWLTKEVR